MTDCINTKIEEKKEDMEIERSKWRGRRQMAWTALVSMILVTILYMFAVPVPKIEVLMEVVSWFYITMATVIAAYMGTTTWASLSSKREIK